MCSVGHGQPSVIILTNDGCLAILRYYKFALEPKGSGELKIFGALPMSSYKLNHHVSLLLDSLSGRDTDVKARR